MASMVRPRALLVAALVAGVSLAGSPPEARGLAGWTGPEVPLPGKVSRLFQTDGAGRQYLIAGVLDDADPLSGYVLYATNASGKWVVQTLLKPTDTVGYGAVDYVVTPDGESYVLYVRGDSIAGTTELWVRTNRTGTWMSKRVLTHISNGVGGIHAIDLAVGGALNGGGQRIHVAWMCNGPSGEPSTFNAAKICFKSESPSGALSAISLTNQPGLAWYPQLAADADGHVHLLYHYFLSNVGYDLMYGTNAAGVFASGKLVWSHERWSAGCLHDEPWSYDIVIGPNGIPQVGWSIHNTTPLQQEDGGCGGNKGLFYGRLLGTGQWSIAKIRQKGIFVNLDVDSLNRPHWLVNMCLPDCQSTDTTDNRDLFHAVRTATGWTWTRVTGGWANDQDGPDSVFGVGYAFDTKALAVMPWNKPCLFLHGGFTSDPYETADPWVLYRTCQR